jgi:arsenate reductase
MWNPLAGVPKRKTVLYLCRINSGRSLMAEAITNHFSGGSFRAFSAGIEPVDAIPGVVLDVLRERRVPTAGLRPKRVDSLDRADTPLFDFVITTCDPKVGEPCPVWPGQPIRAHWSIEQPAGATPEQLRQSVARMYDQVFRCVNAFVNLPYEAMDRLRLGAEVTAIGRRFASSEMPNTGVLG